MKRLLFMFICGAFLSIMTSCEIKPAPDDQAPSGPQMMPVTDAECVGGQERNFPMQHEDDGPELPATMSYRFSIGETPAFAVGKDCVCRIEKIALAFDDLPASNLIEVQDENGVDVAFDGPFANPSGPGEFIEISDPSVPSPVYLLGFDPGVSPEPTLLTAGGFCIVDNVSGPRVYPVVTEAWVSQNTETLEYEIFLPTEMTVVTP